MVQESFLQALGLAFLEEKLLLRVVAAGQCFLEVLHATKTAPDKALRESQALGCAVKASAWNLPASIKGHLFKAQSLMRTYAAS